MPKNEIRFRPEPHIYEAARKAAHDRGISMAALVSIALYDYVNKPKPPEPKRFSIEEADMSEWLDDEDEPLNVGS